MKSRIDKLEVHISLLKQQLEAEKKTIKELRSRESDYISGNNELEAFFLECITEIKKDIQKRQEMQSSQQKFSHKSSQKSLLTKSSSKQKLQHFQSSDKKKVIENLLQNDSVLLLLYENMFPQGTNQASVLMQKHNSSQERIISANSKMSMLTAAGINEHLNFGTAQNQMYNSFQNL